MTLARPSYLDADELRCDVCLRRVSRRDQVDGCGRCEYGPWLPPPVIDIRIYLDRLPPKKENSRDR